MRFDIGFWSLMMLSALTACAAYGPDTPNGLTAATDADPNFEANVDWAFPSVYLGKDGQKRNILLGGMFFKCDGKPQEDLSVYLDGDKVQVGMPDDADRQLPDGLQKLITSYKDAYIGPARMSGVTEFGANDFLRIADGWVVAFDLGEFGGSMMWFGDDGQARTLEISNTSDIMLEDNILYAAHGLDHLSLATGKITAREVTSEGVERDPLFEVRTNSDIRKVYVKNRWVYGLASRYLLVIDPDLNVHYSVKKNIPYVQRPNSIVTNEHGIVFVGGESAIGIWNNLPFELQPDLYVKSDCEIIYKETEPN
jgi:hypothetical protein